MRSTRETHRPFDPLLGHSHGCQPFQSERNAPRVGKVAGQRKALDESAPRVDQVTQIERDQAELPEPDSDVRPVGKLSPERERLLV